MDEVAKKTVSSVPYDTQPAGLEKWLDETFHKKAPFQLPSNVSAWIANNSWWIVLVGAGLSVLGILSALNTMNTLSQTSVFLEAYGVSSVAEQSRNTLYLSMITSAVAAVLLFMASAKLKAHQKSGWNLVYYSFLINVVVTLLGSALLTPSAFVMSLVGFIIGFAIGAFLLFQIRSYFAK